MLDITTKYDDFLDYVVEGYSIFRGEDKECVRARFIADGVDQYLIEGYHPLARHNRVFISRKIDEFLAHKKSA